MKKSSTGKLFVLEGIDGSGKATQVALLKKRFDAEGVRSETISFPRYGNPAAYFEERYLRGEYGIPGAISPYASSHFYALDRFDARVQMEEWLRAGITILADRYLVSNVAHQGGKISDLTEREQFLLWLYDLEYAKLGIPRPDLNIVLVLPLDVAVRRVEKKSARKYLGSEPGKKDGHEKDLSHLENSREAYLWIAKKYPDEFRVVDCVRSGRELTEQETHEEVWGHVSKVLG